MNHRNFILLSLLFLFIKFKLSYQQYPNTVYEAANDDDNDDDEYEYDNNVRSYGTNENDYSEPIITDKRRSITRPLRLDPDILQEHLYSFKSNVLNGSEVSTLKNKNFTWSLLNKNNDNGRIHAKKLKPVLKFQSNLKNENEKTTDWINLTSGIQSDQPAVSPSMNADNQTSIPSENDDDDDDDEEEIRQDGKKMQGISPPTKPKTSNANAKLFPNEKNDVIRYAYAGNRTGETNNNNRPISSNPYRPSMYPGIVNQPYYPRYQQSSRQYYRQQPPIIINGNQQPYYSYQPNIFASDTTAVAKRNWTCEISSYNNCSIVNDPQTGPLFQVKNYNYFPYQSTSKPEWYLVLNTTTFPDNKIGARLITPYLPHNQASKGCLTLTFITTGKELDKIMVHQQDIDDKCIYSGLLSSPITSPSIGPTARMMQQQSDRLIEHNVELTINLRQSDPRFFIEIYVKRLTTRQSSFAFSKMNLAYEQSCQNDQSNNCFQNIYPSANNNQPNKRNQIPVEP
uniref:Uncharacterized protein LOC113793316 n=1 Tax=Dermatophagoides pteronyssinus TaxID=6956 RepID=A0A6P6Y213_DERPT|nr:uncharacterized protein LOC113793316 [Dermatophagoides pteronyssinus]